VFGRGGEEGIYLREHGVDFEVIPGVTSAIAGPAAAGIPVTHRGVATGFHVLTAHGKEDRLTDIDFSKLTDEKETCVFLMGLRHVREVADSLISAGRRADTPAAVISHATTKQQRTCIGTLSDIAEKAEWEALTSPAIIVVGDVVTLSGQLSKKNEKTYIVPYIKSLGIEQKSLAAMIRGTGVQVIEIPIGEIRRCPLTLSVLSDWLIFTSKNAVESFFPQLFETGHDARFLCNTKIAAVGEQTARQLKKYGIFADFIPTAASGASLGEELFRMVGNTASICFVKGREGGTAIAEAFHSNPNYRELIAYENCELAYDADEIQEIRENIAGADGIFFTSASAAKRICRMTDTLPHEIYSIGPTCTKQLHDLGYPDVHEAAHTSYEGLVECTANHVFKM
jgi:uroporphyrinogen III methyltransferase/synthase